MTERESANAEHLAAELTEELAKRDALASEMAAAGEHGAEAARLTAEIQEAEGRLFALESRLENELRSIATERAGRLLARYADLVREIADTATDLACYRAMAGERERDKLPPLALELPLLGLEASGFTPPPGFRVTDETMATDPGPMFNALAKRYRELREGLTGPRA